MDKSLFKEVQFTEDSSRLSDYTVEEVLCSYRNIPICSVADNSGIHFVAPWHYYNTDEDFYDAVAKSETLSARLDYMKKVCIKDYCKLQILSKHFNSVKQLVNTMCDNTVFDEDTDLDCIGSCITFSFIESIANHETIKYLTDIQNGVKSFNDDVLGNLKPTTLKKGEIVLINNPFVNKDAFEIDSKSVVVNPGVGIPSFIIDSGSVANLRCLVVPVLNANDIINIFNIKNLSDVAKELERTMEEIGKWALGI